MAGAWGGSFYWSRAGWTKTRSFVQLLRWTCRTAAAEGKLSMIGASWTRAEGEFVLGGRKRRRD